MELATNLHTIDRFELDVSYFEAESARNAQQRVSDLASEELTKVFENLCNEYGQQAIYKLQKLTIDLGDIPEESLHIELVKRFETKFKSILEALNRGDYTLAGVSGFELQELDDKLIQGIIYFIQNGTLPFYVQQAIGSKSIKEILFHINENKIPVFLKELRNSTTTMMAIRRIVRLFPGSELLQFFHFLFPDTKNQSFEHAYHNLMTVCGSHQNSGVRPELLNACREFFVGYVLRHNTGRSDLAEKQVFTAFLSFLEDKKNVLPEKWMPEVISTMKKQRSYLASSEQALVKMMSDYYINYLSEQKLIGVYKLSVDGLQKNSQNMKMKEVEEETQIHIKTQLNDFVKHLVNQVKHYYTSVEEERIETVILGIADEILPTKNVASENIKYWAEALSSEVKRLFGIAIETSLYEGVEDVNLIAKQKQKTEKTIGSSKSVSSSVALAYWAMFLSAGITPFEKLYVKPKSKLKPIFSNLIEHDPEAAIWQLKQHVNETNVMIVAWWFKESLGDELFDFFKSQINYGLTVRLEDDINYSAVMTSALFATGNFPWPELNNYGQASLIQRANDFILELDEFSLERFVLQNDLFGNAACMKKVFAMVSVQAAKKLLQVKRNLIEKGKIADFTINHPDKSDLDLNEISKSENELNGLEKNEIDGELEQVSKASDELKPSEKTKNNKQSEEDTFYSDINKTKHSEEHQTEIHGQETEAVTSDISSVEDASTTVDQFENQVKHENISEEKISSNEVPGDMKALFEKEKQRWGSLTTSKILDEIAYDILHFKGSSFYDSIPIQDRASLVFRKITIASGMSYYQTAAMLVDLPRREMTHLLEQFDNEQRDYIKKLVRSYRSRFVSMAEDIRKAEEEAQEQNLEKFSEANDPIFIKNAGMVLLNPYLMRLFKRFDLVEGKKFKDNGAKEKGVYLLQYLVNKGTDPEEFDLPLNKIICDIPLGVPIKTEVKLTDEEMKICDGLLDAIVKNWGALKNTSSDGLRTSFLMREGTLHKEASSWKLFVEKKAYDILLKKLPWGYSLIQLPWMEIPLYTEWEGN